MAPFRFFMVLIACFTLALLPSCGGSGGVGDVETYFPDGTMVVVSVRLNEILNSEPYKKLFSEEFKDASPLGNMKKETGIDPALLDRITMAMKSPVEDEMLLIIHTTRDVKREDVEAFDPLFGRKFTEKTAGSHKVFVSEGSGSGRGRFFSCDGVEEESDEALAQAVKDGNDAFPPPPFAKDGFEKGDFSKFGPPPDDFAPPRKRDASVAYCIVSPRLVVLGPGKLVTSVLERGKAPALSAEFTTALAQVDFSQAVAMAFNATSVDQDFKDEIERELPVPLFDSVKSLSGDLSLTSTMDLRLFATCKDATTAADFHKILDGLLAGARQSKNVPPEFAVILSSIKITASGDQISATVSVDPAALIPPLREARLNAKRMMSSTQLRGLIQGAINYAPGNRGKFPMDLGELAKNSYFTPEYVIAPFDTKVIPEDLNNWKPDKMAAWVNENSSYFFLPGAEDDTDSKKIAAFERLHTPGMERVAVGFRDCHVESLPIAEASALIKAQTGKTLEELSKLPRPGAGGK
ncbi:MAG: hypothetical protein WD768_00700 [Phycisphaeraceae bacterium]